MAIIYSYPHAIPSINDMVLGAQFKANKKISTNSFYISDIIALVQGQLGVTPTLQAVTEEGANTTIQIQINGVDVATVNDIPAAPGLQEVTNEGDTTTNDIYLYRDGIKLNIQSNTTTNTLTPDYMSIYNNISGIETYYGAGVIQYDGNTFNLPTTFGTIALTTDIPTPSYRVYTALINQSGTTAPYVISVLENTLGGTVTFEYTNPGLYYAVLAGEFTSNKTTAMLWGGTGSQLFKAAAISFDRVLLVTYNTSGSPENNQMGITTLEIKVYN